MGKHNNTHSEIANNSPKSIPQCPFHSIKKPNHRLSGAVQFSSIQEGKTKPSGGISRICERERWVKMRLASRVVIYEHYDEKNAFTGWKCVKQESGTTSHESASCAFQLLNSIRRTLRHRFTCSDFIFLFFQTSMYPHSKLYLHIFSDVGTMLSSSLRKVTTTSTFHLAPLSPGL